MSEQPPQKMLPRNRYKAMGQEQLDAMVRAHQKERGDAEDAKIARLKALRVERDAQVPVLQESPAKNKMKPKRTTTKQAKRRTKYLGGYE